MCKSPIVRLMLFSLLGIPMDPRNDFRGFCRPIDWGSSVSLSHGLEPLHHVITHETTDIHRMIE